MLAATLAWTAMTLQPQANPPAPRGKSVVYARHGMVATSHPLAAQIGLDTLKQGGNAVDAAIATNAALALMEPTSCGLGGDLFALVWIEKEKKLYALNASGRAPKAMSIEAVKKLGHEFIPARGALAVSIPGCVDGWTTLSGRLGTMPLAKVLEPTIRAAEEGAPIPETIASAWRGSAAMLRQAKEGPETFLFNGQGPREGDVFKNPRLAATLSAIAKGGKDAFYKGEIANQMVEALREAGGMHTLQDFANHSSTWVDPISTDYRGYQVWQIPPNGQGLTVLQMLNILEGYDLKSLGAGSAETWHLMIEAKKLAYADRARYYADPAFVQVPWQKLVSKEYAAERRKLIDMNKALESVRPGDLDLQHSDTVYLTVVDKDRNCVSLIQSNYQGFGSGLMAGKLGFMFQNRGQQFSLDPAHPNRLEGGKRPFHTIIPGFVTKDGKPWFSFGVMGGDMQPQGQVQVLVNMIDFGMDVQAAGDFPRLEHNGSATPEGRPASGVGNVVPESAVPASIIEALRARGHVVAAPRRNGGGYQGILIDWQRGVLAGASESRRDGQATGY